MSFAQTRFSLLVAMFPDIYWESFMDGILLQWLWLLVTSVSILRESQSRWQILNLVVQKPLFSLWLHTCCSATSYVSLFCCAEYDCTAIMFELIFVFAITSLVKFLYMSACLGKETAICDIFMEDFISPKISIQFFFY